MVNNEYRAKSEMWDVYKKLPKGTGKKVKEIKTNLDNQFKAWAKLDRIKKNGMVQGGYFAKTADWVLKDAQFIYKNLSSKKKIEKSVEIIINVE